MAELDREPSPSPKAREADRVIDSRDLLGRDDRVQIQHGDQRYELRRTRFGKLILTK